MRFLPRHRLVGRAASVGVLASVMLGSVFATNAQAGHSSARSAAPASGGSYSYRVADSADCLDPQLTGAGTSNAIDSYVFDTLLSIDKKGHYVGDLATKYKVANGGTRLTFTLRKNVAFSNGDPLTAQDVKYTFDRALDPATKSPASAAALKGITSTTVVNKYTVQVNLSTPSRPLLTNLAGAYTAILDKKWFQSHSGSTCTQPVGSGPYKIKSTSGDFSTVTLVANKRHNFGPSWVKNKGVPYITTVTFKTITSDATAVSEMLSSGVDIGAVPGTQLNRVQGHKSVALHKLKPQGLDFIEFNVAKPPFNSLANRKAFVELIDRKAIVSAAYSGQAQPVYGPLAPGIPYYDKAASKYMPKYNPSAAAKTIAANHVTGPYTYLTVGLPTLSTEAEILQHAAGNAGMQLTIDTKSGVGDWLSQAAKGDFNVTGLAVTYNDPDVLFLLLHSSQGGGKGLNVTGNTSNPALDSLLQKGHTTLAKKKIATIYNKAQILINKQLNFIGLVSPTTILAIRSNIKGYHVDSAGAMAIQDLYIKTK
jgi:peptide/nickel transport system substrate-binding protein